MSNVLSSLHDSLRYTLRAARRVPVEILLGIATAILLSLGIADPDSFLILAREGAMTVVPTLLLVLSTSALYELTVIGPRLRWGLTLAGLGAGLAYGLFVLDTTLVAETWRWLFLTGGVFFGAMMIPWAARPALLLGTTDPNAGPNRGHRALAWQFNLHLGVQLIVAGTYATLLTIGTLLGILAFDTLFEMGLAETTYAHVAAWIYAVGGTGLFAIGLPSFADRIEEAEPNTPFRSAITDRQANLVYRSTSMLLLPLLGLYVLVLYAYGGRVLITGEAPSNLLSPLALGAALLGLIGLYLIDPLLHNDEPETDHWWLSRILGAFPVIYLPLVPMPAWAIWIRVQQHGWTEFRYLRMLSVFGILLCLGWTTWKTIRGNAYSATVLPAIFGVLLLLGTVGPWGALSVSERSQIAHLRKEILDVQAASDSTGSASERHRSRSKPSDPYRRTRYLFTHFGGEAFRPLIAADRSTPNSAEEAQEAIGLPARRSRPVRTRFRYEGPVTVPGTGTLYRIENGQYRQNSYSEGAQKYRLQTEGLTLILLSRGEHNDKQRDTLSLRERLPALHNRVAKGSSGAVPESLLTFKLPVPDSLQSGPRLASPPKLMLRHLTVTQRNTATRRIESAKGHLFVPHSPE